MDYLWNNFGLISECSIKTSSNAHVDFSTPSNSHAFMVETFYPWFSQTDAYRQNSPRESTFIFSSPSNQCVQHYAQKTALEKH